MSTPPDDEPTRIGGRYRLDERIGAGAMGVVWRGTDELLNRTVALKELLVAAAPPTAAGTDALEESRQRILREGRIGARLQHAHVISMFDVVVHDDRPWLVMEYLPSKSLAAVLAERGPLPPGEVAEIGRQVADGLAAAHLAGVVHRDVKPGNVLIGEDGRVKLTDFGVSRAVDDVQLTRTGMIAGTPAFLSPEVARGQDPTAASDVFALGATLYAAVEGRPPFGLDDNAYALLHKVATGEIEPPQHAGPLTGLLLLLLSTAPADRPSATQARDALAAVAVGAGAATAESPLHGAPVVAPGGPKTLTQRISPAPAAVVRAPRTPDRERRRRAPALLAVVAGLLIIGGGVAAVELTGAGTGGGTGAVAAVPTGSPTAVPPSDPITVSTSDAPSTTAPTPAVAPVPTPALTPTPAVTPTPAPAPSSSPAAAPPASSTDPVAFLQRYYAFLPGNTDAAFALLSPGAQSASGGRGGFDRFYAGMNSVTLRNVRQIGDSTVDATVVFDRRNGASTEEPYRFVMSTGADGTTIMQSFSRV